MDEAATVSGSSRSVVFRVLLAQIGIGAVLAAVFWGLKGHVAGYSALLGSLTCVIPNGFLALRLAAAHRDPGSRALMRAAWIGEVGKLGLTVLMFSIVFLAVRPLAIGPLFTGFIAAQLMVLTGLLMHDEQGQQEQTSKKNGD